MNLKEGKNRHTYIVCRLELQEKKDLERRLEALGLTEGSRILVLNNDKKGAMTVKFRGTRFALGRKIADHIMVKEEGAHE